MIFSLRNDKDEIKESILRQRAKVKDLLLDLNKDQVELFQYVANRTVFAGMLKGFGVRSGKTRSQGFLSVSHQKKGKQFTILWARISNLYQNFKTRKPRVMILSRAVREFKKRGEGKERVERALEDLSKL